MTCSRNFPPPPPSPPTPPPIFCPHYLSRDTPAPPHHPTSLLAPKSTPDRSPRTVGTFVATPIHPSRCKPTPVLHTPTPPHSPHTPTPPAPELPPPPLIHPPLSPAPHRTPATGCFPSKPRKPVRPPRLKDQRGFYVRSPASCLQPPQAPPYCAYALAPPPQTQHSPHLHTHPPTPPWAGIELVPSPPGSPRKSATSPRPPPPGRDTLRWPPTPRPTTAFIPLGSPSFTNTRAPHDESRPRLRTPLPFSPDPGPRGRNTHFRSPWHYYLHLRSTPRKSTRLRHPEPSASLPRPKTPCDFASVQHPPPPSACPRSPQNPENHGTNPISPPPPTLP